MSYFGAKFERPQCLPGTRARATFEQLVKRWGETCLLRVDAMGGEEFWRWVGGAGKDALFELKDEEPKP